MAVMAQKMTDPANANAEPDKDQKHWQREIRRAEKHFGEKFIPTADKLYKLYARQSDESDGKKKYAMLWANTEVLKPSVYARPPVPQVSRRYRDKDPVGRLAAELLERACSYEFERMNVDSVLRAVRDDLLLPGRGVAWLRYEADIEADPKTGTETVAGHRVVCDYVHYSQFLHEPQRRWEEVSWVAKKTYMGEKEGKERFGESWKGVELDNKADSSSDSDSLKDPALVDAQTAKATVYEIWCKKSRKTIFIAKACDHVLAIEDPLLDFENFFPCPKPVYATVTNNSLIPTPDYKYYQDQAQEVDLLTNRIDKLMDSLKVVGFYPAGAEGDVSEAIAKALSPNTDNQMIPVASWAAFGERGGSNAIIWLPIRDIAETIKACVELRNQVITDIYQITGISDILRGSTEASETATAQQIKAQWGSVRIRDRQQELVRLARDITRMACEIIAEMFDPEYIARMANMEPPQPPPMQEIAPPQPTGDPQQDQMAMQQAQQAQQAQMQQQQAMQAYQAEVQKYEQAFAVLRDDRLRGFRIDIETDSTIQPDEDAEKQRRTEFVTAIGGLIQQAVPLVAQVPEMASLVRETLLFTARGFRAGRQLEDQIEQTMQSIEDRLKQQMSQKPQDPNAAINEAKAKQMQAETEHKAQMWGMEREHIQQKSKLELQTMAAKARTEIGIKQKTAQADMAATGLEETDLMGLPGEEGPSTAQLLVQAVENLIQTNQQMMQALTAPKIITAPDGRRYTSQTAVN